MSIAQPNYSSASRTKTNSAQTLDFTQVVQRAYRTIRMTTVILGFLTWFAISATTWLVCFALDNLLDLPTSLRFPIAITGLIITIGTFFKCVI